MKKALILLCVLTACVLLSGCTDSTVSKAVTNTFAVSAPAATPTAEYQYIYNKATKRFHYPWCSSVEQMKEKNKGYYNGIRTDLVKMGYKPCSRCEP